MGVRGIRGGVPLLPRQLRPEATVDFLTFVRK